MDSPQPQVLRRCVATLAFVLACLCATSLAQSRAQPDPLYAAAVSTQKWFAGAASITITPPVDGRTDYIQALSPTNESAGTFVRRFDFGIINVGNGKPNAHWVRDELCARAAAIGPDPDGFTTVFVSVEVYMLFMNDLEQFHQKLRAALGSERYDKLRIVVHAEHNHSGPDTGGVGLAINQQYYAYLMDQMVSVTVEALDVREPVQLHWGIAPFYYGLGDIRDPRLQDANVRTIRAVSDKDAGRVVVSLTQWGMHPEVTLGYSPPIDPLDCQELLRNKEDCSAQGRFFSHDYPGWFSRQLAALQGGGHALFFNGAIGAQIGNHAPVWTPTDEHPLGDGREPPPGAPRVPVSFYLAYLIGTGLANFTGQIKAHPQPVAYQPFEHRRADFWVRFTNFFFKVGGVPTLLGGVPSRRGTRPLFLGDTLRPSWICDPVEAPSALTCRSDDFDFRYDPTTNLPYRLGNYLRSEVQYLRLGPVQFITAPLELPPELATGLPADFDTPQGVLRYYNNPELHATGSRFELPGVVFQTIPQLPGDSLQFLIGLCGDELGYSVELPDIRLVCSGDEDECRRLYQAGAMNYSEPGSYSMAGAQCIDIMNRQEIYYRRYLDEFDPDTWRIVNNSCFFGQRPDGYPRGHYDETNSASIVLAQSYLDAVASMFDTKPTGRYCQGSYCDGVGRHECLGCR